MLPDVKKLKPTQRLVQARAACKRAERIYVYRMKVAEDFAKAAADAREAWDVAERKLQEIFTELDELDRAEKAEVAKEIARKELLKDGKYHYDPTKAAWRNQLERWRREGF